MKKNEKIHAKNVTWVPMSQKKKYIDGLIKVVHCQQKQKKGVHRN